MTEQGVMNIIDKISDKLTVPATEIINAYALYGYKDLISTILFFIISTICLIFTYHLFKKDNEVAVLAGIFSCFPITMFITFLMDTIIWINNPRGYAILEIMKHLR